MATTHHSARPRRLEHGAGRSHPEHIGRGESIPTLRLYAWDPACLSLGHAQPFADVDMARLNEHGWEVVRRATGGRAILHTDEITYSVIAPNEKPRLAGTVLKSYNRLAQALLLAVKVDLPVEMKEGKATTTRCPTRSVLSTVHL